MTQNQTIVSLREAALQRNEPEALRRVRETALDAYDSAGLPDNQHESWRKLRLDSRDFDLHSFRLFGSGAASASIAIDNPHGEAITVAEFARILEDDAAPSYARVIEQHLNDQTVRIGAPVPEGGTTNQGVLTDREPLNIFQLQNLAAHTSATFVGAKSATPREQPLKITHRQNAPGESIVQRTLIYAAPGAELTVLEEFRAAPGPEDAAGDLSLWNCETFIVCGDNARVNYISLRHYAGDEYNFHRIESTQGRDARVHVSIAQHGGYAGKSFVTGRLTAPGGEFRGIGLAAASGGEYLDMEMLAAHDADHTNSSLLYKTVVRDRAHSVFNGNLMIPPGRKHVDSHQTNNNILLNKKARAESMPKLIVKAEDVAAEHGATVGELDSEAIFFLMSRGLSENDARVMMIEGFLMQVIAEFPVSDLHESLLEEWKAKLSL
ncbi:MAG: Fe-S cluster assembly protein SufD [bacterium]|nr:Fe-S cluster assembly protein SufD [bacterium]